ncbi:ABC transporter substrate-binding protein [Candidatus Woesearchaeota archaeon]|nr:ABC transporter substrate-binding protein [Candidatus Woesearchaeota archaeon]
MKRTKLNLAIFVLAAALILISSCSAPEKKVYKVGILSGLDFFYDAIDGFKVEMTELGYIEGENIVYDIQRTDFDMEAYKRIANKFVEDEVDLIFVYPTEASIEVKNAVQGKGIPVVFAFAMTEDSGLIESIQAPGGHITGSRYPTPEIAERRFNILLELVPDAKTIWIPYQKGYPTIQIQMKRIHEQADELGITLIEFPTADATSLESELKKRNDSGEMGFDAVLFLAEPLAVTPDAFLVISKYTSEHNIPAGGAWMEVKGYRSLFGVIVGVKKSGMDSAFLADKIFKGIPAGTIPVISSSSFFQLDYLAAQQYGLNISSSLINTADEIIS